MKNTHTLTLSKKKYVFNILNSVEAVVEITDNPFGLPLDTLFTMAARINKKRSFLFVSKMIGKHIPIDPQKGLLISALLACRYIEVVKQEILEQKQLLLSTFLSKESTFNSISFIPSNISPIIIGFAETATALGHAFFDCFEKAEFFHTTREFLENEEPVITFEEEHSHATSHRCYIPIEMIQNNREIILVDDEITTGKTALNIIQSIHAKFPRNDYTIVSILDWRSESDKQKFKKLEMSLGINIKVVSLLSGNIQIKEFGNLQEPTIITNEPTRINPSVEFLQMSPFFSKGNSEKNSYLKETGRFGIRYDEKELIQQKIEKAGAFLKGKRNGEKTLCLGTGEFMYIPMKIALEMGRGVSFHSTTRSPIFIQNQNSYGARYGFSFPNPENLDITHFAYNIPPGYYDDLFLFFEKKVDKESLSSLLEELKKTEIGSIKVVYFTD